MCNWDKTCLENSIGLLDGRWMLDKKHVGDGIWLQDSKFFKDIYM